MNIENFIWSRACSAQPLIGTDVRWEALSSTTVLTNIGSEVLLPREGPDEYWHLGWRVRQQEEEKWLTVKHVPNLTCLQEGTLQICKTNIRCNEILILCRSLSNTNRIVEYLFHLHWFSYNCLRTIFQYQNVIIWPLIILLHPIFTVSKGSQIHPVA